MIGAWKYGWLKHPGFNKDDGGSTTTTTQNFSPEEAAKRVEVMNESKRIYDNTKDIISSSPYPGAAPVPFSPETQAAQQYSTAYALGPAVQQAANMNNAVNFGLSDVLYANSNPYMESAISAAIRPITESYVDPGGVMSQIRDSSGAAGQFGSSRQGIAEGIAAGRYADAIGDTASRMANENYQKGLDTFSRTLAFAPQALQAGLMPANILSGVGAQNEMQAQQMEQYLSDADMWALNSEWAPLQNYASIVFGGANPSTMTTGDRSSSTMSNLGGIGSLMMGIGSLFSDRRLKDGIEQIGKYHNGLNKYKFFYKNAPRIMFTGVMADEVEELFPEAVAVMPDGFKAVDYGRLGIQMERVESV